MKLRSDIPLDEAATEIRRLRDRIEELNIENEAEKQELDAIGEVQEESARQLKAIGATQAACQERIAQLQDQGRARLAEMAEIGARLRAMTIEGGSPS